MLYDPRWGETKTKPSIYTREGLIEWLEAEIIIQWTMYGIEALNVRYDWGNPMTCIIGQYLGAKHEALSAARVLALFGEHVYDALRTPPWTLGAALKRLRGEA